MYTRHLIFAFLLSSTSLWAITPQESEFFEKQIRPVLAEQCYKCHGPEKQKSELRVDSRAALIKGGDNGTVMVPGKPEEGTLIKSIRHEGDSKMPAKADKLSELQIAAMTEWVKMGAPWPEGEVRQLTAAEKAAKTHWSFQPVKKPAVPTVANAKARVETPVDAFLVAKLEAAKLGQAPAASRRVLIRRATYDLTGLPPSAEEIAAFENDPAPDAYARLIDRLLASPRYGERWGRYWLDVARYADTKGYVFTEERRYPFSYTYRDWVIAAFNSDMPYDKFLIQQIAADQLAESSESLAALGFLTLGRRFINNINDIIDDRIDVICRGTMGLTTVCARCHDHKFDPISQKDYYALYGVFASSTEPAANELPLLSKDAKKSPEYVQEREKQEVLIHQFLEKRANEIGILMGQAQGVPIFMPAEILETIAESNLFTKKAHNDYRVFANALLRVEIGPNAPARAMAMVDKPEPVSPHIFIRGNPSRPGEVVPRRFLTVLSKGDPKPFAKGSGRLELAQSIASKENPLTARVFVNRVWAHHFGAGLVRTPSDFGVKGDAPTHPELLDWLASQFMESGWSTKKLHRLIMLSSAYQQVSDTNAQAAAIDPENRLLWRMNRQRLDFESMRDSLLYVVGQLDQTMGGRPVEITGTEASLRRSVYGFIDRQNLPGIFRTFDFASPDTTNSQRHMTTVPQQALFMMNSPFIIGRAKAAVARPEFARKEVSEWQVQDLFRRVLARNADAAEIETGIQYVTEQFGQAPEPVAAPIWQYGYGGYQEETKKMEFHPFTSFTANGWQFAKDYPNKTFGFVRLSAQGGHAGRTPQSGPVRRWVAPKNGTVAIHGMLNRPSKDGDGVIGRIISSRLGEVASILVEPGGNLPTNIDKLEVQAGDTIDFLVDSRSNDSSDTFTWEVNLRGEIGEWDSKKDFAGPPPPRPAPLTPWEKYAQALLATNEFVFVD